MRSRERGASQQVGELQPFQVGLGPRVTPCSHEENRGAVAGSRKHPPSLGSGGVPSPRKQCWFGLIINASFVMSAGSTRSSAGPPPWRPNLDIFAKVLKFPTVRSAKKRCQFLGSRWCAREANGLAVSAAVKWAIGSLPRKIPRFFQKNQQKQKTYDLLFFGLCVFFASSGFSGQRGGGLSESPKNDPIRV